MLTKEELTSMMDNLNFNDICPQTKRPYPNKPFVIYTGREGMKRFNKMLKDKVSKI